MELSLDARLLVRDVVVINLQRRTDRYEAFMGRWRALVRRYEALRAEPEHPERLDWPPLRLTHLLAYDGRERAPHMSGLMAARYGCLRSHLTAMQRSPSGPDQPLLVFEDDAVFEPDLALIQGRAMPRDWDLLWLGGQHRLRPDPVTSGGAYSGLVRTRSIYRGHAYVVRYPVKIARMLAPRTGHHDEILSGLPVGKYALWPGQVGQAAMVSDITGHARENDDYWNDENAPLLPDEEAAQSDTQSDTQSEGTVAR